MPKTFKDKIQSKSTVNPTLQFISAPEAEEITPEPQKRPQDAEKRRPEKRPSSSSSTPQRAPQARRALPQFDEETKSRRLQLLLTPSLYDAIKDQANREGRSVNELINSILKDAMRK